MFRHVQLSSENKNNLGTYTKSSNFLVRILIQLEITIKGQKRGHLNSRLVLIVPSGL